MPLSVVPRRLVENVPFLGRYLPLQPNPAKAKDSLKLLQSDPQAAVTGLLKVIGIQPKSFSFDVSDGVPSLTFNDTYGALFQGRPDVFKRLVDGCAAHGATVRFNSGNALSWIEGAAQSISGDPVPKLSSPTHRSPSAAAATPQAHPA